MALITLPPGNVLVPWIGPATTLAGQPWFTAANLSAIYRVSANRLGYIANKPGGAFPGFTQVLPTPAGQVPDAYIFVVKNSFQLDSALVGQLIPNASQLIATFAPNAASIVTIQLRYPAQEGSYVLDATAPITGLTNVVFRKNGTVVNLTTTSGVALLTTDVLTISGQTGASEGLVTLTK